MNLEDSPQDILLPIKAVCEIVARSRASIYRDIKRGGDVRRNSVVKGRVSI